MSDTRHNPFAQSSKIMAPLPLVERLPTPSHGNAHSARSTQPWVNHGVVVNLELASIGRCLALVLSIFQFSFAVRRQSATIIRGDQRRINQRAATIDETGQIPAGEDFFHLS